MILAVIYFIKALNLTGRARIIITTSVWCFVWASASYAWSFLAYTQYPFDYISHYYWRRHILPGLLSTLVLFGTSIFFFITRNYPEEKILSTKSVKKAMLVDPRISSDTQKDFLGEIFTANLKDNINSLTCVKCGSIAKLSFYTVIGKSGSRDEERESYTKLKSLDAPVCASCSALYDSWHFNRRKTDRHSLRTIGIIISFLLFAPLMIVAIFLFIIIVILPFLLLAGVIILIVSIVKRKKSSKYQNSPYRNIRFGIGNKVLVKPDNFKKWTSLQDWALYSLKIKELGQPQISEIETILLNFLDENKGVAFSPNAIIKRAIGENFTEKYAKEINNLLEKMTRKGLIDSNLHDGKTHYFSS